MSNAILAPNTSNSTANTSSLCFALDNVRAYSTVPTAHVRDMVGDGITGNGIAIYMAIADRQVSSDGEYFRSNESLAEETGLKTSTVRKWLARLKKAGYLSIWSKNGGRRMRVCTKVCYPDSRGVLPSEHPSATQIAPYKENNIKKTTQAKTCGVSSISLSKKHQSLFGEGEIRKLVTSFGMERVERGLLVFDTYEQETIRNPIALLTSAISKDYKPRTATKKVEKFTEDAFEHHRIVREYTESSNENADTVRKLESQCIPEASIAYKIWINKI